MKFIDLFAGIGGLRIAFENAGCHCVFSSEWDRFAQETYRANFGETPAGDIRQIASDEIPQFDILVGGFPCQPFSLAGISKKISLGRKHGFDDEHQGNLFFEIIRIVKDHQPRLVFLENVKNLVSHDRGRTFRTVVSLLEEAGYHVSWEIYDAAAFVPQHRERTVIVACRDRKLSLPATLPSRGVKLCDILERRVDEKYTLSDKLWNYLQQHAEKHREKGNGFGYGLASRNGVTRTLSARYHKDGSEILIPQSGRNPRRLTPRECARLMGFPDSHVIPVSDTQAYRQFGNSVCVPLMMYLAQHVVAQLKPLTVCNNSLRSKNAAASSRKAVLVA
ncbi:MAG: DNA (cytosine-5-)-methyltransferase [Planctomycetaceae bacterium]